MNDLKASSSPAEKTSLSFQIESLGLRNRLGPDTKHDGAEDACMYTKHWAWPFFSSEAGTSPAVNRSRELKQRSLFVGQIVLFGIVVVQFMMLYRHYMLFAACGLADAGLVKKQATSSSSSSLPNYYQTSPEFFPGTT